MAWLKRVFISHYIFISILCCVNSKLYLNICIYSFLFYQSTLSHEILMLQLEIFFLWTNSNTFRNWDFYVLIASFFFWWFVINSVVIMDIYSWRELLLTRPNNSERCRLFLLSFTILSSCQWLKASVLGLSIPVHSIILFILSL